MPHAAAYAEKLPPSLTAVAEAMSVKKLRRTGRLHHTQKKVSRKDAKDAKKNIMGLNTKRPWRALRLGERMVLSRKDAKDAKKNIMGLNTENLGVLCGCHLHLSSDLCLFA